MALRLVLQIACVTERGGKPCLDLLTGLKTSPTPQLQEYPSRAPLNRLGLNVSWPLERITCSLALHSSPQAVPFKGGRGTTRVVVVGRRPLAGFVSLLAYWDAYSTQRFPGGPHGGGDNDGQQSPTPHSCNTPSQARAKCQFYLSFQAPAEYVVS